MFEIFERSIQSGAPIELYEFARKDCEYWRYTNARDTVTHDGKNWIAEPIVRSRLAQSNERARNALTVKVPRNNEVAELFRIAPPTDIITCTLWKLHRQEPEEAVHQWTGRVLNAKWPETSTAELQCEPVSFSLRRPGLRRIYQRNCPHVLYGSGCNLNKYAFGHVATVTAIDGSDLSVGSYAATTYPGGFIEWAFGDNFPDPLLSGLPPCKTDRRFIRSAGGGVFTLDRPFQGIQVGDDVALYPGCGHDMASCSTVFDNLDNYGGMPFMPIKNPFSGDPIF